MYDASQRACIQRWSCTYSQCCFGARQTLYVYFSMAFRCNARPALDSHDGGAPGEVPAGASVQTHTQTGKGLQDVSCVGTACSAPSSSAAEATGLEATPPPDPDMQRVSAAQPLPPTKRQRVIRQGQERTPEYPWFSNSIESWRGIGNIS